MVRLYTRKAEQKKLATSAVRKLERSSRGEREPGKRVFVRGKFFGMGRTLMIEKHQARSGVEIGG
jgi:hypothetical protein